MACKPVIDKYGRRFKSKSEMCRYYGVPIGIEYGSQIFEDYLKYGQSMQHDHLGQAFYSIKEMLDHWGISDTEFNSNRGRMPLRNLLEHIPLEENGVFEIIDPYGRKFQNMDILFYTYRRAYSGLEEVHSGWKQIEYLYAHGLSLEEKLGIISPLNYSDIKPIELDEHLTVIQVEYTDKMKSKGIAKGLYYTCSIDGEEIIMNKTQILNYWRKIKGLSKFIIEGKELKDII